MPGLRQLIPLLAVAVAVACSGGAAALTVSGAAADPTYSCPANSSDAPYDLHAIVHLHNPTSSTVTVKSVTAEMKLEATKGPWLEKVGDVYNAGSATFSPSTAPANSDTTLQVTIRSACTSPAYAAGSSHYGDYRVILHLKTSAGSFSITSGNVHRIVTA